MYIFRAPLCAIDVYRTSLALFRRACRQTSGRVYLPPSHDEELVNYWWPAGARERRRPPLNLSHMRAHARAAGPAAEYTRSNAHGEQSTDILGDGKFNSIDYTRGP